MFYSVCLHPTRQTLNYSKWAERKEETSGCFSFKKQRPQATLKSHKEQQWMVLSKKCSLEHPKTIVLHFSLACLSLKKKNRIKMRIKCTEKYPDWCVSIWQISRWKMRIKLLNLKCYLLKIQPSTGPVTWQFKTNWFKQWAKHVSFYAFLSFQMVFFRSYIPQSIHCKI